MSFGLVAESQLLTQIAPRIPLLGLFELLYVLLASANGAWINAVIQAVSLIDNLVVWLLP